MPIFALRFAESRLAKVREILHAPQPPTPAALETAHALLTKNLASLPQHADSLYHRGIILYKLKRYEPAIRDFLEIIADTPGNLAAHYYLGLCYYGNGNRSKACEHLTICIDASREAAAQSTADWVGFDEGTGSVEGVASVESLIAASAQKKFPFPQALIARANTYFRMGNFSLAFKDLDEVWQIYHDAPEQQALAISYCQNNLASIRARFSRAIEGHSRKIDSLERHEAQLQERTTTSLAAIDAQIAPLEEQIKTADLETSFRISNQLLELKKRKKAIMEEEQSQSKQSELESAIRDLAAARRHLASVERAISVLQARTTGR